MKPATIHDVARKAGVSVASVSRVVNELGNVREETRQRVLKAARVLNYVPHGGARSLSTQRTDAIGVLLPDLYGEFFSELIRGVDSAARELGVHLLLASAHDGAREAAATLRALRGRVDGMLVMSPHLSASLIDDSLAAASPIVVINSPNRDGRHAALAIDNYNGARTMTRHLVETGHRRIVHIGGPADNFDSAERERGYSDELMRLAPEVEPVVIRGNFSEESGHDVGSELSASGQLPDAVFAANDMIALGCVAAFQEAGLDVPRDVGVAGFDDIPLARYVRPALTTMRVRIAELGHRALKKLAECIAAPDESHSLMQTFQAELVVRQSCGSAPPPSD